MIYLKKAFVFLLKQKGAESFIRTNQLLLNSQALWLRYILKFFITLFVGSGEKIKLHQHADDFDITSLFL